MNQIATTPNQVANAFYALLGDTSSYTQEDQYKAFMNFVNFQLYKNLSEEDKVEAMRCLGDRFLNRSFS